MKQWPDAEIYFNKRGTLEYAESGWCIKSEILEVQNSYAFRHDVN